MTMVDHEPLKERPNKSALKRELAAVQQLAVRMAELSNRELERLGMGERVRASLAQIRSMSPSGARNRELKHCTRLLQQEDLEPVRVWLDDRQALQLTENQYFHRLEKWRDRLVDSGDEALAELIAEQPDLDRQHLRQLVREAQRERQQGRPGGAARKLFRYLREALPRDTRGRADGTPSE
jgi:ribosome-associated protein